MAMRLVWKGDASFALAVGGLHPKFALPAGFPRLDRIALALTTGDNPQLICQAYFAITSNTSSSAPAHRSTPPRSASASRATSASTC